MKTKKILYAGIFLPFSIAVIAFMSDAEPSYAGKNQPIPLMIKGTRVDIRPGLKNAELKTAFAVVIKDQPTVDTDERLQYDVVLVNGQAPATFFFNFGKNGMVDRIIIDSYMKEQNPTVSSLLAWLEKHAGKPRRFKKDSIFWIFAGWRIEHMHGGSGEDSTYRIELIPR